MHHSHDRPTVTAVIRTKGRVNELTNKKVMVVA